MSEGVRDEAEQKLAPGRARVLIAVALVSMAIVAAAGGASAAGDAGHPIALGVSVPVIAPFGEPLGVSVSVDADPGAFAGATAPLRLRVRVAYMCGATFAATSGATAIDQRLTPVPVAGAAYHGQARGHVTPRKYNYLRVCAFLEQEGNARQLAANLDGVVVITHGCTRAVRKRDAAVRALASARHALRHAHGAHRRVVTARVARLRPAAARARKAAIKGCRPPR